MSIIRVYKDNGYEDITCDGISFNPAKRTATIVGGKRDGDIINGAYGVKWLKDIEENGYDLLEEVS